MIACDCAGTLVELDETTARMTIVRDGHRWRTSEATQPALRIAGQVVAIPFCQAEHITAERRTTGTGEAVTVRYEGFAGTDYAFETHVWIESTTGDVIAEWVPLNDAALDVTRVTWPAPFTFDEPNGDWVTLITHGQGTMIPNDWPTPTSAIPFDGRYWTEGGYMPFHAQIRDLRHPDAAGYVAICETPANAGYVIDHPAHGPHTHIGTWFEPSLGRMDYRRTVRYRLLAGELATVTGVAKTYRAWADEHGLLRTLAEKAVRNPSIRQLPGCMWMHVGAKTHIQPDSSMYDAEHPERNDALVTFGRRADQLRALRKAGVGRLYMHLDGWGQPGYDNQHPDYLPACAEAGGWEGLRALADTAHECGYLFGLHDQYRDYHCNAATHDDRNAVRLADGSIPEHARWAGGRQQYLCGRLAPDYVKRNYREIAAHGVELDGTYLDVFTCNEGDECANPGHRMSRADCYRERARCFRWLLSRGILTSSEEVADWAMPVLVFCHYAPYDFQLAAPDAPRGGVPVPLQNLVYHDCVIEPWMMDRVTGGDDYMLYALLNGGAPYLIRDAAYAGIDGDVGGAGIDGTLEDDIARCRVVADLHRRVGMLEMTGFDFVDGDVFRQRTVFADGTSVSVDLRAGTYRIVFGDVA
ncbi:DUF5696 domain-containing protein [Bifidobacterium pullorum]|uniref:DUF5696 domain-containing protein n=1 Tax=Bifidobacterium pullorum TaxID=78448 RepID=UPI002594CF26|nr:DUF5696 domain-containing protein [uncultured Bifidobacterium sp.]